MTGYQPPDGVILDALEHDLTQWHVAQARRDIDDLRRISDRLRQRRAEVDQLHDGDRYLSADADLVPVEREFMVPEPIRVRPVTLGWDDETHLQRWWPTYATVLAVAAGVVAAVWLLVQLVVVLTALLAVVIPFVMGVVGLIVLVVVVGLLCRGGGGRSFSGTFRGRIH